MNIEYMKWWSDSLSQDMEMKIFGHAGKPALVFPTQGGRFFEFEDFGMVEVCRPWIDSGSLQLYCVDSIDNQSWANWSAHPADRARRHEDYDRYIVKEVAPFIRRRTSPEAHFLATGCSMGAYHAGNFFFRHPDLFDISLMISGPLSLGLFIGDYMDDLVYCNTPAAFLPNLNDPWYIDRYRQSTIVVCTGQGAWEEPMIADARRLEDILRAKEIPAWIDYWGLDVNHDWPWWKKMLHYHLERMDLQPGLE